MGPESKAGLGLCTVPCPGVCWLWSPGCLCACAVPSCSGACLCLRELVLSTRTRKQVRAQAGLFRLLPRLAGCALLWPMPQSCETGSLEGEVRIQSRSGICAVLCQGDQRLTAWACVRIQVARVLCLVPQPWLGQAESYSPWSESGLTQGLALCLFRLSPWPESKAGLEFAQCFV
jgi:hypothetical protein